MRCNGHGLGRRPFYGLRDQAQVEWNFESSIDWALLDFPLHQGIKKLVSDLNSLYTTHLAWSKFDHYSDKFKWVDCQDAKGQTLVLLKIWGIPEDTLLVACNFSQHHVHRDWGCPHPGNWEVIIDTDSPDYSGKGSAGSTRFSTIEEPRNDLSSGLSFSVSRWSVRILKFSGSY